MNTPNFNFKFDKKTINRMKELTIKSDQENREYGGTLCGSFWGEQKLTLQNECVGTHCKIKFSKNKCKYNNPKVGNFHTHPNETTFHPSTCDIINNIKITCIGNLDDEKNTNIKCFMKKLEMPKEVQDKLVTSTKIHDDLIDQIDVLSENGIITKEKQIERYRLYIESKKYIKEKMNYLNKYFKIIDAEDCMSKEAD